MMKIKASLYVVLSASFLFGCVSTQNDTYTREMFEKSIFTKQPTGSDSIISRTTYDAYQTIYKNAEDNKAIAQSDTGASGYSVSQASTQKATETALSLCQQENKAFENQYPCELININGEWQAQENKAFDILVSIPNWTPPNVNSIDVPYREIKLKKYKLALAKHVWYFQNAVKVDKRNAGPRISFFLGNWARLGEKYPASTTLLRYAENASKISAMNEPNADKAYESYVDYIYINKHLKRPDRVVSSANWFEENRPEIFEKGFKHLKGMLLDENAYQLYSKYIQPEREFQSMQLILADYLSMENISYQRYMTQIAFKRFSYDVSRLIAALVINNRHEEAEEIAAKGRATYENKDFYHKIEQALQGILPDEAQITKRGR